MSELLNPNNYQKLPLNDSHPMRHKGLKIAGDCRGKSQEPKRPPVLEVIKSHLMQDFITTDCENDQTKLAYAKVFSALAGLENKLSPFLSAKAIWQITSQLEDLFLSACNENLYHAFNSGFDKAVELSRSISGKSKIDLAE